MNLIQFYKENIQEDEYYYRFYDDLITRYESMKKEREAFTGPINDEIEYEIFDDDEAIDLYKKLIQPDTQTEEDNNNNKYILVSYYLLKKGYKIREFPRILERPETKLYNFSYTTIRRKLVDMGKMVNGQVSYAARREFIANLHFEKITDISIDIDKDVNELFKKISTNNIEFMKEEKNQQLCDIANIIENMLKEDDKYINPNYEKISFKYINNDMIKNYRKQIQCFRHATNDALKERENFSKEQKNFLIEYGILIVKLIYKITS